MAVTAKQPISSWDLLPQHENKSAYSAAHSALHLMSVLMRFVWMSYSRSTAFLICFLLARTSVMNTCGEPHVGRVIDMSCESSATIRSASRCNRPW